MHYFIASKHTLEALSTLALFNAGSNHASFEYQPNAIRTVVNLLEVSKFKNYVDSR